MFGRAATVVALTAVAAAPASGQFYRADFGINGGYSWFSDFIKRDDLFDDNLFDGDVINGFDPIFFDDLDLDRDASFDNSWLVGSQLGYWFTRNFGIRANGAFAPNSGIDAHLREFVVDPILGPDLGVIDTDVFFRDLSRGGEDMNIWNLTGDLMYRFVRPRDRWEGSEFLPYIAGGLGATWIDPDNTLSCLDFDDNEAIDCAPFGTAFRNIIDPRNTLVLSKGSSFTGLVGLGADWRFSPHWAVRMEVNDRIYKPRVYAARFGGGTLLDLPFGRDNIAETVHQVSGQLGISYLFGLVTPPVVAVAPPPPPPPVTPLPAPPPPPPAREVDVTICLIDVTGPGTAMIRTRDAKFLISTGDTVVEEGGRRIPIRQLVSNVIVAQGQDWFVRGTPFVLAAGNYRAEYVTYGMPVPKQPEDLTFLGTMGGIAVFADRDEVASLAPKLAVMTNRDLTVIIRENTSLREELDDIKTLYVPHRAIGCTFQPLLRQEPVRKGGKDGI
jgi:hypothetical protein